MPRPRKNIEHKVYMPIAQAEDIGLGEDCVRLLRDNEIEARAVEGKKGSFMVEVEEGRFHEAYILIQSHLTPEGFFDIHNEAMEINDPNQAA